MTKTWRLYASTLANTFGSWCTFLALALLVKEKFGPQFVPLVFLTQTLPIILFSRTMTKIIPEGAEERWYFAIQVIFTFNSLVLLFWQSPVGIFCHLFIAALLKGLSGPLFNTLITRWVPSDRRGQVFTRIDALSAGALSLAPAAGAWVKIYYSNRALFLIDALSFLVALALIWPFLKGGLKAKIPFLKKSELSVKNILANVDGRPRELPACLILPLVLWLGYQVVGALLNGYEFSNFAAKHLDDRAIGYALGAWGLGNLITFAAGQMAPQKAALVYFLGLLMFVLAPSAPLVILSFLIAGIAYSALSGGLRSNLVNSVPKDFNPLPVWSFTNQLTQFFNLLCYLASGFLLNNNRPWFVASALLLVACGLWIGLIVPGRVTKAALQLE